MKTKEEIEKVLSKMPSTGTTKFSGMTYEQGIEEALLWALGEMSNDEFEYAPQ
jgi:hypothetical protein